MASEENLWSRGERLAWKWPESITPSQWAEANRFLPSHVTAEPGPWRNERTPYLVGIMDAICEPGAEEVGVVKAAQVGFSESLRNELGFWIDHDPGPCLIVMPDQKSAEELIEERVKPLLQDTPAVARHVTSRAWDVKKSAIRLDTMSIYVGWAGSSQALKSRPIRYLLLEEPDEYPPISGAGGDPISKAMKRVTTYAAKGRARVIIGGTPTTRIGNVWRWWESCGDQRYFWVPCPHCGKFQRLVWKQVKWSQRQDAESRKTHAARVQDGAAAWYECEHCAERIAESQKSAMLRAGKWAGPDQVITPDGRLVGPASRRSRRIGFHLSAIYSPWVSLAKLAAEWIEAQDDQQQLADFINQRLAEPFEEQRAKTEPTLIAEKAKGSPPPMIVPAWTQKLIATADTQGNDEKDGYFCYVIRAWGFDYRSQLIDFGVAHSKAELIERCLNRPIAFEKGGHVQPQILLADSGGPRWSEIYQLAQNDNRIHPTKGAAHHRTWMMEERPQKKHGVVLWEINTEQSKDLLHRLIHDSDRTKWLPHNQVNEDYCRQMCSESKIFNPAERREEWVEIVKNNNHFWDCYDASMEVLTSVGWKRFADLKGTDSLATVNTATDAIEYQVPTHLIAKPHKGPMIQIGGGPRKRVDLLVTPTHRMAVYAKRFKNKTKSFTYPQEIKLAKDLTIWDSIKLTGKWMVPHRDTIRVPAVGKYPVADIDARDLARLAGWYVAEGYCRCTRVKNRPNTLQRSVFIYQNLGDKRDSLRCLLQRLPWTFCETPRGFSISGRQLYDLFCGLGNKYTKRVPQWVRDSSAETIRAFLEAAVDGDGWRHKTHEAYATVSKLLADDVQELYIKIGHSSAIYVKAPKPYTIRGKSGDNTVTQYHVHRKNVDRSSLRNKDNVPNFKTVHYDGMVYCATVPNGTLIVRRNGKVAICGNCEHQQCAAAWRENCGIAAPPEQPRPPQSEEEQHNRYISGDWQIKTW